MHEPSDALVVFGVTGDLTYRKIIPALHVLAARGRLRVPVLGVARPAWSDERLRVRVRDSLTLAAADAALPVSLRYVSGDYRDAATYAHLRTALGARPSIWRCRRSCSRPSSQDLPAPASPNGGASSSKSRSTAIWPPRAGSMACCGRLSRATRSTASITSSARRRS